MRAVLPVIAVMLAAGAVRAQPVTQPDHCRVTVVLAPEDVRHEIEAWVAAEPRCERELEVRVVPTTDHALYLSARDPEGRVRERIVPDAQSAAVLVVSWMADDSLGRTLPVGEAALLPPDPDPPAVYETEDEVPSVLGGVQIAPRRERFTLAVGLLGGEHDRGVRAQLDLVRRGRWVLGVAAGATHDDRRDAVSTAQARVFVGVRHSFGRFTLRAQFGFGVDATERMEDRDDDKMHGFEKATPAADVSVLGTLPLSGPWGLVGGPVFGMRDRDDASLSFLLGITRSL